MLAHILLAHILLAHTLLTHILLAHILLAHVKKIEETKTLFVTCDSPFILLPPEWLFDAIVPFLESTRLHRSTPARTTELTKQDWREIVNLHYSFIREYNHTLEQYGDNMNFPIFWYRRCWENCILRDHFYPS